jgi:alkanesulfonate monooxygenase SsuD/methylene tetrahydromethanopterin reductase-like flavin-dependent oxidoreductase (luciferase family)
VVTVETEQQLQELAHHAEQLPLASYLVRSHLLPRCIVDLPLPLSLLQCIGLAAATRRLLPRLSPGCTRALAHSTAGQHQSYIPICS